MPITKPPFVIDADTLLAYRCNETAAQQWTQLRDDSANAFHVNLGTPYPEVRNWNSVSGRLCRKFQGSGTSFGAGAFNQAMLSALLNTYTLEVFANLSVVTAGNFIDWQAAGETEATNFIVAFALQASGRQTNFWEYDLGTNGGPTFSIGTVATANVIQHHAFRKLRVGHIMDSNVQCMFGLDEGQGTACADLSPNARNITWVAAPTIANGKIYKCRTFNGSTQYGTSPAVSAFRQAVDESMTAEAWINVTTFADATICAYGGATAATANRQLFDLSITAAGKLHARWERDSDGVFQTFTGGTTMSTGTWYHVAMVRTTVGAASTVELFINGVSEGTSGSLTSPTVGSGTTSLFSIGRSPLGTRFFTGSIDEVRISSVARTGAEVLAGYTSGNTLGSTAGNTICSWFLNGVLQDTVGPIPGPTGGTSGFIEIGNGLTGYLRSLRFSKTYRADATILADSAIADHMHTTDAETAYHWKMTDLPDMVDDGPYGVHLRNDFTVQTKTDTIVNDAGGTSGARYFPSSSQCYQEIDEPRADVAAQALGELTVRIAAYLPALNGTSRGICSYGETGFEADDTRNYLWALSFTSARLINFGWERLAGASVGVNSPAINNGGLYIIHCVRRTDPVNVGRYIGEIWLDGERVASTSNLQGPTGGSNSRVLFGAWSITANANTLILDDYHVQKRALTEYEIRVDAGWPLDNAYTATLDLDTAAPVLTANSPANGATLAAKTSTLIVDVTDAALGTVSQVMLACQHTGGSLELIYKGGAYQTGYSGSTSVITGGTRFTFTRTAGWLTNPSVKLYARDGLGNEGNFASSLAYVFTPDAAAPVMTANTPANGATITVSATLSVDVADAGASGLAQVILVAQFSDGLPQEVVWKAGALQTGYSGSTSVITNGTRYNFTRTAGWRATPTIKLYARDSMGNEGDFVSSLAYVFTPESTAPAMAAHSPTGGAVLASGVATIAVNITDASTISRIILAVEYDDGEPPEVVYDGAAFTTGFSGSTLGITNGTRYTFFRAAGWRADPTVTLYSRDNLGNEDVFVSTIGYLFDPPPLDAGPPTISNFSPAPDTELELDTPISFDVEDDVAVAKTFIIAKYLVGTEQEFWEVVYDGADFAPLFADDSTVDENAGVYTFTLIRTGGWAAAPTLVPIAIDTSGSEAA